jgi:hypothetical protein
LKALAWLALAGCAAAGRPETPDGHVVDAPRSMIVDGPPDASARAVTLAQTTSSTVVQGNSFACNQSMTFYTDENSYYRVFPLADANVTGPLHVESVQFLVEQAKAGSGGQQPATINLGIYAGTLDAVTLDTTQVVSLASAPLQIPDGTGTTVVVPIVADVPAGSDLVVELHVPDGTTAHNIFFFGSNSAGESHHGYLRAPVCSTTTPTTISSIATANGLSAMDILLTVSGTW